MVQYSKTNPVCLRTRHVLLAYIITNLHVVF